MLFDHIDDTFILQGILIVPNQSHDYLETADDDHEEPFIVLHSVIKEPSCTKVYMYTMYNTCSIVT